MTDRTIEFINLQGEASLHEIAKAKKQEFLDADPFPHIVIDNLINEELLIKCAEEFPDLSKMEKVIRYSGRTDEKLASPRGNNCQPKSIYDLLSFLNSSEFIDFLQELTSVEEPSLTHIFVEEDFIKSGGGFLKIHADYCKRLETNLDRRINVLLYLNKEWDENFGGHLELYDKGYCL